MGKLKFTLSNILFWIAIIASCLLLENVPFLTVEGGRHLNDTHFFMLLTLAVTCYLGFFIFEHVKNKVKVDFALASFLLIGFVCALLGIWLLGNVSVTYSSTFTYSIDTWTGVKQSLSTGIFFVSLYAMLFFFNKNYPSIRKLAVIFLIIVFVAYGCCIYSLIAEFSKYSNLVNGVSVSERITSFFWNPNMFAGYLLMGIIASMGLNYFKRNVFSYLSIVFFLVINFFVCSLTGMIVSLSVTFIYLLIEIIFTFRRKSSLGATLLILYLMMIVLGVVMFACALSYDLGNFSYFCKVIYQNFSIANYSNLSRRTLTWSYSLQFLSSNPMYLMFGVGYMNANYITAGLLGAHGSAIIESLSSHSGYIQTLMNFGVIGTIIYFAFIVYFIYSAFRVMKTDARFSLIFLLIGLSILGYGVMESFFPFNPNVQGVLLGFAFFLPVINKWKHLRRPQLGNDAIEVSEPETLRPDLIVKTLVKFFMACLAVLSSVFIFALVRDHYFYKFFILNFVVVFFILTLFFPFIVSCISINKSRIATIWLSILNFAVFAGVFSFLITHFYLNRGLYNVSYIEWVYPGALTFLLGLEALILGLVKKRKGRDYVVTFVAIIKNSSMGVFGVVCVGLSTFGILDRMDVLSKLTYIIYPVISFVMYYLFSYIVPMKDQNEILAHFNLVAIHSLKKEVIRDRLGVFNEKRRD